MNQQSTTTIHSRLGTVAGNRGDATAVQATGRQPLSYARLAAQIDYVVERLRSIGLRRQDKVALVLPNAAETLVAFLGVSAGAACAPLNFVYRAEEFEFYLADLDARAVVIQEGFDSVVRTTARKRDIAIIELLPTTGEAGTFTLECSGGSEGTQDVPACGSDVALALHTSGTTSRPKLVPLTQANICTTARNIQQVAGLTIRDRCLSVMPLFHIHGLMVAVASLMSGGSVVVASDFSGEQFFSILDEFAPTWYSAVPTIHQAIVASAAANRRSADRAQLRFIRSSSAALPARLMSELEDTFRVPVIESYGMTEASHQIASNPLPPGKRKQGSVGLPAGPEIMIVDEARAPCPDGQVGEILIRGDNVLHAYSNETSINDAAFVESWFRTGDQGYFDSDGYLYITGRLKEIINRGGEKISPREVDVILAEHPCVAQGIAFGLPHPTLGEDVGAAVVVEKGLEITETDIRDFLGQRLADFKVPRRILFVNEIPKGPTGKVQRLGLYDILRPRLDSETVAPRTPLEKQLSEIWARILRVENVGVTKDFFDAGGNSLMAAQLFSQIETSFGRKLSLSSLFAAPTIEGLARLLEQGDRTGSWSPLVPIQPKGGKPPIFCIHGHDGNVLVYRDLARFLGVDQPFYGLQARGLNAADIGSPRLEDIAGCYIEEIRSIQPRGPYFFLGFCLGGMIAFEMAQQLRRDQHPIAFLALIDTYGPCYPRPLPLRVAIPGRVARVVHRLATMNTSARKEYLAQMIRRRARLFSLRLKHTSRALRINAGLKPAPTPVETAKHLEDLHRKALLEYAPAMYSGNVIVFAAQNQPQDCYPDPYMGWKAFAEGGLEVCHITEDHDDMMHSKTLADRLQVYLRKAQNDYSGESA